MYFGVSALLKYCLRATIDRLIDDLDGRLCQWSIFDGLFEWSIPMAYSNSLYSMVFSNGLYSTVYTRWSIPDGCSSYTCNLLLARPQTSRTPSMPITMINLYWPNNLRAVSHL